jgi:molybdopterin-guanine dinucleotide biosynthesis protein A
MPRVTADRLRLILDAARSIEMDMFRPESDACCVMPESAAGFVEPLCAAYHKRALPLISQALDAGTRKVADSLPRRSVRYIHMPGDPIFQNINTPEEWAELRRALEP